MENGPRRVLPERMDAPDLDPAAHRAALRGLARINAVSRAAAALWPAVRDCAAAAGGPDTLREPEREGERGQPLRVLDLASGGGDVVVALERRARRAGLAVRVEGCDCSPEALAFARDRAARAGAAVRFFQHDLLAAGVPPGYDVYLSSLFLHHLPEDRARDLLRGMAQGRALAVLDLERSRVGWWAAWLGTRVLTRSRVVHHDGPLSVRNAFTAGELEALAHAAGLAGARVRRCWPFRILLRWERSPATAAASATAGAPVAAARGARAPVTRAPAWRGPVARAVEDR